MSDDDMTPEEYEEHMSGHEADQGRINDLEAQIRRLQRYILWLEAPPRGELPPSAESLDSDREWHGLHPDDMDPPQ